MLARGPVRGAAADDAAHERVVLRCLGAFVLVHLNRVDDARALVVAGVAEAPELRVKAATMGLSVIAPSVADIAARRAAVQGAIDAATADLVAGRLAVGGGASPLALGGDLTYFATYHGLDDAPLRRAVGRMYRLAFPSLSYVAPPPRQPCAGAGGGSRVPARLRIGFVTAFASRHSVTKMFLRLMCGLPTVLFEVLLFTRVGAADDVRDTLW